MKQSRACSLTTRAMHLVVIWTFHLHNLPVGW